MTIDEVVKQWLEDNEDNMRGELSELFHEWNNELLDVIEKSLNIELIDEEFFSQVIEKIKLYADEESKAVGGE